eukprot:2099936-Pleurochrysis_carterae.AAC.1
MKPAPMQSSTFGIGFDGCAAGIIPAAALDKAEKAARPRGPESRACFPRPRSSRGGCAVHAAGHGPSQRI